MPRSIWTGRIAFGLVNVPVKLVTAVREKKVSFHMLTPDGSCRLRRKLYCPDTGKEYDFSNTARGYEIAPDHYVLIDKEELDAVKPEAGRTIEIEQFIDLGEIDPLYFDPPYLLLPDQSGESAYSLLIRAMIEAGEQQRVGIARFVMRQKQHLAAIRVVDLGDTKALALHTIHYHDEVVALADPPDELLEGEDDVAAKQVKVARQLIDAMSEPFDPTAFKDDYREKVEELIEAKKEGEGVHEISTDAEEPPETYNLMEALKKSVEQRKKKKKTG